MALVVEDGTGIANAASYISLVNARAFLATRGLSLNVDDTIAEQQLRLGTDYTESYGDQYTGTKYTQDQALEWPRSNAVVQGFTISVTEIPLRLGYGQAMLASEIEAGVDLTPIQTGRFIVRDKIDVMDTWFSERINTSGQPRFPAVDIMLIPLLGIHSRFLSTHRA